MPGSDEDIKARSLRDDIDRRLAALGKPTGRPLTPLYTEARGPNLVQLLVANLPKLPPLPPFLPLPPLPPFLASKPNPLLRAPTPSRQIIVKAAEVEESAVVEEEPKPQEKAVPYVIYE